ncbi:MAG: oligosaccharide repeat unit polymerase [Candidatus Carbobacillus altaicus]|nr:oligosaccharide repeat unit polymerase [Candidatus Carbobacillus altaicus]
MNTRFSDGQIFVIFAAISLSTYLMSLALNSNYLNIFTLVFLMILTGFWIKQIQLLWIFVYLIFGFLLASFVSVLIEYSPVYLSEVGQFSYFSGSAARNISLMTFFLSTTIYVFYKFSGLDSTLFRPVQYIDKLAAKLLLVVAVLVLLYIYAVVFLFGSPLTMRIDRFNYMLHIARPEFRYIYSIVYVMGFVVAYAGATEGIKSKYAKLWFIFALIALILVGEKFSQIFLLAISFFTPYIILGKVKVNISRFLTLSVIFLSLSIIMILYSYYNIYGDSYLEIFYTRLGLQAQMMFMIDTLVQAGINGFDSVFKSFTGIGANPDETGIYYLMYLIAPDSIVDAYYERGVRFTMPFPANFNYFFGYYFSPLLLFPFATFAGVAAVIVVKSIQKHNFLLSFIAYKFLYNIYANIVMGEMYWFFKWNFIIYMIIFLLYFSISLSQKSKILMT